MTALLPLKEAKAQLPFRDLSSGTGRLGVNNASAAAVMLP